MQSILSSYGRCLRDLPWLLPAAEKESTAHYVRAVPAHSADLRSGASKESPQEEEIRWKNPETGIHTSSHPGRTAAGTPAPSRHPAPSSRRAPWRAQGRHPSPVAPGRTPGWLLFQAAQGRLLLPPLESRPADLQRRIREGLPVLHFAFGSNLSLQKLTSRVPGRLQPLALEPALVRNHRLAFNLRALPPLEPTMASIEPVPAPAPVLEACARPTLGPGPGLGAGLMQEHEKKKWAPVEAVENAGMGNIVRDGRSRGVDGLHIHGVLVTLSPEDYDALYISEGGGAGAQRAYIEYEVTAVTYQGTQHKAVAFRANPLSPQRLPKEREELPSRRYLSLILAGAKERGLNPLYVSSLEAKLRRMRDAWNLID